MPNTLTPESIDILCDFDDDTLAEFLVDWVTTMEQDAIDLGFLYTPTLLARLAQVHATNTITWEGRIAPALRTQRGIFYPDFLAQVLRASHRGAQDIPTTVIRTMDTVSAEAVSWLWWPYLPLGTLAMLDGDPGIGKSMLTLQIATNLSRGWPFPDQQGQPTLPCGEPAQSIFLAREDSLTFTVRPRLDALGADVSKIHYIEGIRGADGKTLPFTLEHLHSLRHDVARTQARFIVIDPIQAYLGAKIDMHRANETRPLLDALSALAEEMRCSIVCVRHPAKASGQGGGKAMLRGLGSIDFIGAARTGIFVEQHPLDRDKAMMALSKSNIGPKGRTHIYSKTDGHFQWVGVTRMDIELLAGNGRGPDPQAFLEAYLWLEQRLEGGIPVPAVDLFMQAEEERGLSEKILRKARKSLGALTRQRPEGWVWSLPSLYIYREGGLSDSTGSTSITGTSDVLTHSSLSPCTSPPQMPILRTVSPEDPDDPVDPTAYTRAHASQNPCQDSDTLSEADDDGLTDMFTADPDVPF